MKLKLIRLLSVLGCALLFGSPTFGQTIDLVDSSSTSVTLRVESEMMLAASGTAVVEYETLDGEVSYEFAVADGESEYVALSNPMMMLSGSPVVMTTLYDISDGSQICSGLLLLNDTDTLGEDWEPLDPADDENWNGCEGVAGEIQMILGCYAEIIKITPQPPAPGLGEYRGVGQGWAEHWVVVKNGKVYDGFGPADGLSIDDYKDLWTHKDAIDFGF